MDDTLFVTQSTMTALSDPRTRPGSWTRAAQAELADQAAARSEALPDWIGIAEQSNAGSSRAKAAKRVCAFLALSAASCLIPAARALGTPIGAFRRLVLTRMARLTAVGGPSVFRDGTSGACLSLPKPFSSEDVILLAHAIPPAAFNPAAAAEEAMRTACAHELAHAALPTLIDRDRLLVERACGSSGMGDRSAESLASALRSQFPREGPAALGRNFGAPVFAAAGFHAAAAASILSGGPEAVSVAVSMVGSAISAATVLRLAGRDDRATAHAAKTFEEAFCDAWAILSPAAPERRRARLESTKALRTRSCSLGDIHWTVPTLRLIEERIDDPTPQGADAFARTCAELAARGTAEHIADLVRNERQGLEPTSKAALLADWALRTEALSGPRRAPIAPGSPA